MLSVSSSSAGGFSCGKMKQLNCNVEAAAVVGPKPKNSPFGGIGKPTFSVRRNRFRFRRMAPSFPETKEWLLFIGFVIFFTKPKNDASRESSSTILSSPKGRKASFSQARLLRQQTKKEVLRLLSSQSFFALTTCYDLLQVHMFCSSLAPPQRMLLVPKPINLDLSCELQKKRHSRNSK